MTRSAEKGWPVHPLGDLFEIQLGKMLSRKSKVGTSPAPYLTNRNIQWGSIDTTDLEWMDFTPEEREKFDLNVGDLLVCEGGEVGRTAIWHGEVEGCFYQKALHRLRPKDDRIDPNYMLRFMEHAGKRGLFARLTSQTSIAHLTKVKLARLLVPLPSLPEQQRIAAILDKADALRKKQEEAIRLSEEFLLSAFMEMFGDPIRNPMGHEEVALGEIGEVQGGLQVTSKRAGHPVAVPYLRVANVYRDRLHLDEVKELRVTEAELERVRLVAGDVLIVEGHGNRAEIGRSSAWDGSIDPCVHQNHLIRLRLDAERADPWFVSAFLNSPGGRRQLFRFGKTTSGLNTISTSNVRETKTLLPPIAAQRDYRALRDRVFGAQAKRTQQENMLRDFAAALSSQAFRGSLCPG
jgi:type I restriction enzyme, S subunit